MDLQQQQQAFMQFLLHGDNGVESSICEQGKVSREHRLNIYRNAYQVRLIETLLTDHEILAGYLGDDLFKQMSLAYIEQCPSSSTSLRAFGQALPDFLHRAEPFVQHPEIADLAQFERLLLSAFDAAESARATPDLLTQLPPETWPELVVRLHPSAQVFSCNSNAVQIWQHLKQQQNPPSATIEPQHWLLWRNQERLTEFKSISEMELALLNAILNGANFSQLCDLLLEFLDAEHVAMALVQQLQSWLQDGIVQALETPAPAELKANENSS